ncbi:MAG: glycerophosphodiester phosphodiesterase [Chloroflexi bacterium]|nr:MAG: glycerophosphodiester phosphodiesterase [Chloroflexota bacterium]MBL1192875.1 glycerophosphodiester phosphodiesterase [Chloroflexota bacterium]NOH10168.1 glycerophosphodiester phosphodiesterase [Chloroflexota bacterium]
MNKPIFEIVAHRGVTEDFPENTIPAFQRAIELGADAVELDVRLTRDHVPVVYHYYYLKVATTLSGPIFNYDYAELKETQILDKDGKPTAGSYIPTFVEFLEQIGGRIGLEIEIKGPEGQAPQIIGNVLNDFKSLWSSIEVTSFEPALLHTLKTTCPGITVDLLLPRSEAWMGADVVAYRSAELGKLTGARAVHLHPTQLTRDVVDYIAGQSLEIHSWDVNDQDALQLCADLGIPKLCTDHLQQALNFRASISK